MKFSRRTVMQFLGAGALTPAHTRAGWDWRDVCASAVVLICILGSYLYFRG